MFLQFLVMGAISKHVLSEGEWCAPTRELKNSKLLKLVHQTRRIITETGRADAIEVTPEDEVVLLVNRKPRVDQNKLERDKRERSKRERSMIAPISLLADGSIASYPVYRDSFRPLRVAFVVMVPFAAVAAALFVLLAR